MPQPFKNHKVWNGLLQLQLFNMQIAKTKGHLDENADKMHGILSLFWIRIFRHSMLTQIFVDGSREIDIKI